MELTHWPHYWYTCSTAF